MNTFSNFSSVNGWAQPGSGTWVSQDPEDFYVDDNGDIWIPCLCGEGDNNGDSDGPVGRAASNCASSACGDLAGCRCVIEYERDKSGSSVFINYPEAILYYPARVLPAGCRMGMLADSDKGGRWFYKGEHSGKLRLHISQMNATRHTALQDPIDPLRAGLSEAVYPGTPLRYAILLENYHDTPAAAIIRKQGAGIGCRPNAAPAAYFRSKAEEPFEIPPMSRVWLYLGRPTGSLEGAGPCKFLRDESRQAVIGTDCAANLVEAQLDLEFSASVTVTCCAYADKKKVGGPHEYFSQAWWPLPPQAGVPEGERLKGQFAATTGVSDVWQLEGRFAWALDDATCGRPVALGVSPAYDEGKGYPGWITNLAHAAERRGPGIDRDNYFVVRGDILPLRVPVARPAGYPADLDRMLFEPPPGPVAVETRGTECIANLVNWGVLYHQTFGIENKGRRARRVQYHVTNPGGPDKCACIHYVSENRIINCHSPENRPARETLVANILVPAGEKRTIETCFILGGPGSGGLGHRLTAFDVAA